MADRDAKDWLSLAVAPFRTLDREEKQKLSEKERARQKDLFERTLASGSYEPQYATQRGQSPQSRAYLESILAGNNPDMIFSTAPNAAADKKVAGAQRDKMFGTQQQLIDRGASLRNQPMPNVGIGLDTHRLQEGFSDKYGDKTKRLGNEELTRLYQNYIADPTPENQAAYESVYNPATIEADAAMPIETGYQGVRGLGKGVERRTGERAQKRKRRRAERRANR
jgi:hypothetical protein